MQNMFASNRAKCEEEEEGERFDFGSRADFPVAGKSQSGLRMIRSEGENENRK